MISQKIILNEERNVTLMCYIQDGNKNRPAMIVIPGGGYSWCSDREADPVALAYMQAGYHAFVLRYSVKQHATWPNPLNDYDEAMALIRENAEKWHIYKDKIGVVGFSAGGHLAAAAATMSQNRPNAAILGYAVASEDVKACNMTAPDTTLYVDKHTCPCFLFATRTDDIVPIHNSLRFMNALDKHNISFESHIYAYGPHGFSTNISTIQDIDTHICNRAKNWVNNSIEWLKDMFGDFKDDHMTEPKCGPYSNHDNDDYLSLDCSLGLLFNNQEALEIIRPYFSDISDTMIKHAGKMTLGGILGFMRTNPTEMEEINKKLNRIMNK